VRKVALIGKMKLRQLFFFRQASSTSLLHSIFDSPLISLDFLSNRCCVLYFRQMNLRLR